MTSRIVKEEWSMASSLKSAMNNMREFKDKVAQTIKDVVWWHEDWVEEFAEKFNLTIYQISWISFLKGVVVVLFLQWLF